MYVCMYVCAYNIHALLSFMFHYSLRVSALKAMNWTILSLLGFVIDCLCGDCMYVNPFRVVLQHDVHKLGT